MSLDRINSVTEHWNVYKLELSYLFFRAGELRKLIIYCLSMVNKQTVLFVPYNSKLLNKMFYDLRVC
jgi:hypothetical protein